MSPHKGDIKSGETFFFNSGMDDSKIEKSMRVHAHCHRISHDDKIHTLHQGLQSTRYLPGHI